MEPYYSDDLVTLYLGDCRDLLPRLALGSVYDEPMVIVTDPPYGMGLDTRNRSRGGNDFAPVIGDGEPFDPRLILDLRMPTVMFGANHYASRLPDSRAWIVWDKRDGVLTNTNADCELIWTNLGGPERIIKHVWAGFLRETEKGQPTHHPTQKPVALMRQIIQRMPPGTVLDPFAGSGSTLIAARELGRYSIGIEIDPAHCRRAAERLGQQNLGLDAA